MDASHVTGAPQERAARARPEFGAEDGELDAVEEQRKFKAGQTEQPFWPQDQLVSDMAIHLALMVEQLGLSASPNDWTQVRSSQYNSSLFSAAFLKVSSVRFFNSS